MKLPKLQNLPKPKRKPKEAAETAKPKAAKTSVRMPRAVEDLYRDMRDRRLLLPALALIAAIVAVPIALKSPKEDTPVAAAFVPPEGSEAVTPAVLTEQATGVRDYRERLDDRKSKNPFADSFTPPPDSSESTAAGELVDPPESSTPSPSDTGTTPVDQGPTSTTVDPGGGDVPDAEYLVLAPQIDVRAGRVQERKRIKDVEQGDLLPHERKAPIVMFLGASSDLKKAHFSVSDGVTETSGDGQCRPRPNDCQVLRLREDEKQYFTFGPDDERYSIKVTDIREVIVDRRKLEVRERALNR